MLAAQARDLAFELVVCVVTGALGLFFQPRFGFGANADGLHLEGARRGFLRCRLDVPGRLFADALGLLLRLHLQPPGVLGLLAHVRELLAQARFGFGPHPRHFVLERARGCLLGGEARFDHGLGAHRADLGAGAFELASQPFLGLGLHALHFDAERLAGGGFGLGAGIDDGRLARRRGFGCEPRQLLRQRFPGGLFGLAFGLGDGQVALDRLIGLEPRQFLPQRLLSGLLCLVARLGHRRFAPGGRFGVLARQFGGQRGP